MGHGAKCRDAVHDATAEAEAKITWAIDNKIIAVPLSTTHQKVCCSAVFLT
jgi:hypothetical protein